MMTSTVLLHHVSKRYRIGSALPGLRALFGNGQNGQREKYHWALKDLSFEMKAGDALGIIGPNGAGKTTVLKLLSKVTYPTSGEIQLNGRFSALIELGAGFHPDLTGRENVFLNGTILGMKRAEIKKRFDEIVDFAGISEYLDTPVKRYSSGMYARLGFAVAAHVDPEIMLVDEVLAVGDMAFRKKCYDRMLQLIQNGTTLVFVSHDFGAVQKVCSRCLVLYRGTVSFDGPAAHATAEYSNILRRAASEQANGKEPAGEEALSQMVMSHGAVIEHVQLLHEDGTTSLAYQGQETVRVRMTVRFEEDAPAPIFACTVRKEDGQIVYDFTTDWAGQKTPDFTKNTRATVEFAVRLNLVADTYHLGVDLAYGDLSRYYDRLIRAVDFVVTSKSGARGIAELDASFAVTNVEELIPQIAIP